MRKVFFTLGAIVLVAVAGAWYFITLRLDGVVESRLERAATMAFGAAVEVGGVHTNLRDGSLTVEEISVANPPGFENPYAVRLHAVEAAVDYSGLEIKRLFIESPEFIIEEKDGTTNFGQMLKTLESGSGGAMASDGPGDGQNKEPIIVIRHFRIDESHAAFESSSLDRYSDVKIDAIEMTDLRGTPSQLAELIAGEVLGELSSEAANELLKAQARKKIDGYSDKVRSKLRGLLGNDDDDAVETEEEAEESAN